MTDIDQTELFSRSVTAGDLAEYQGNGVINFIMPWYLSGTYNFPLPAELPPYWQFTMGISTYFSRDTTLRRAFINESTWNAAVSIAAAKQATKTWKLDGSRVGRWQRMILDWSGDGYIASQKRSIMDYTCTDNGVFLEIVRASGAAGSRVIGLVHLDSLRCVRTNDPETPVLFWDLKGQYHALKAHQVIMFCDMPDPSVASLGIGHCAAEGVYNEIYKLAAISKYINEKVTGTGATAIDFITGLNTQQISQITKAAEQQAQAQGLTYFQGHVLAGILSQAPLAHVSIPLRELPDGFDREKELEISQLVFANRLGLDPQSLNPRLVVSGALGTAQAQVLHEKQSGSVLSSYDAEFAQKINDLLLPESVTFYFEESDLRQEQQEAANALTRAQARGQMVTNGEINGAQALQMAVDANDAPREFIPQDVTPGESLSSEEKPLGEGEVQAAGTVGALPAQPIAAQPAGAQPDTGLTQPQEQKVENALEKLNLNGIQITSAMNIVSQVSSGEITRDQGSNALQILLNLSEQQADRLIGNATGTPPDANAAQKELAALISLKESIDAAREAMTA